MSSILDQYEATMSRVSSPNSRDRSVSNAGTPEPVVSGYINARVEDEPPIFNKSKVSPNAIINYYSL